MCVIEGSGLTEIRIAAPATAILRRIEAFSGTIRSFSNIYMVQPEEKIDNCVARYSVF